MTIDVPNLDVWILYNQPMEVVIKMKMVKNVQTFGLWWKDCTQPKLILQTRILMIGTIDKMDDDLT